MTSRQAQESARPTILLVDDHQDLRRVLARLLTRAGYEVLEAEGGRAALAIIEGLQRAVDLLITDIRMPAMGGEELIGTLADRHVARRILFMTGGEDTLREPRFAGVGVLQKPFSREVLLARVHELLGPLPAYEQGTA
jgi:two-component system, cell cycle sensor histidine kinase and response regulator CckA